MYNQYNWRIIEKGIHYTNISLPDGTVSFGKCGVTFSKDLRKYLQDFECVEIFISDVSRLVGFKPTNNSDTGYKLTKDSGLALKKHKFFDFKDGRYTGYWDDEQRMIIVELISYREKYLK